MLDVRIPMGILFVLLGLLLFFYGWFASEPVQFYTPNSSFPMKLNQPVGAFMFIFGMFMLMLARFMKIHIADRELALREKELDKAERRRQKALARRDSVETEGAQPASDENVVGSNPDQSPEIYP